MKNKLLASASILVLLASCQKPPDYGLQPNNNSNRVKSYTESITSPNGNLSHTYNISYDDGGRVTGMTSATSPGDKFVYAYRSGNHYTMDIFNSGKLSIHEDFFLNAAFLPDSTMQYNDTKDTLTERYLYNVEHLLVTLKRYDYSKATGAVLFNTTTYNYDSNGNLIRSEDTDGETHTYEYYSNLTYLPPLTAGPINILSGRKFNLVKTHSVSSNGTFLGSATMTYTFDAKDRISTEKATLADGTVVLKTYTYF